MRLSGSKKIERFFKRLFDYTQLRKAAHYVRNTRRPNAVFIWIPKNAGTSMYHALRRYGCVSENGPDPIGIHHVLGTSHCNPQVRWIENLEMDFVGRYENLAEDFEYFDYPLRSDSELLGDG